MTLGLYDADAWTQVEKGREVALRSRRVEDR